MKFKIIDLVQGSEEWHAFRRGKLGSSDAASIMGVSPWETPLQAWERISFDLKRPQTSAMKRGSDLEETARKWLNERLNANYQPAVIQSIDFPELIASLDGYQEVEGEAGIIEIKCAGEKDHLEAINGEVPAHYLPQIQHQLMVSGLDAMYYVSFDGKDGVIVPVKRDQKYIDKLFCEEMAFIQRLADFKPPEPIDRDWVEINDYEREIKLSRLKTMRSVRLGLDNEEKKLKKEILDGLEHPRCKVGDAKIQKITKLGLIEYGKIEALQGMDLEPYRKPPTEYWEIRV
jgi:putative phage-type endonuclease